jgi:PKD repeat protein
VKAEARWSRGKLDLTLTNDDITLSPSSPSEGETVTITAMIHFVGYGWVSRLNVGFYKGSPTGALIGTDTVSWVRAGRSEEVSVEWMAEPGYEICVVADPDDTIDESVEDNNVAYALNPVAPTELYAEFTADVTRGDESLTVTFTDQSGGFDGIDSWEWDFGDESTVSDVPNPEHTYMQDGIYAVSLTVTGTKNGELIVRTETKIGYIQVLDTDPVADFTANPTSGEAPLTVTFTDSSVSYDGINSWEWDFGDESTVSDVPNPEHTYVQDGTYSVILTVSEVDGDTNTETKVGYITIAFGIQVYDYELSIEIDYIGSHEPTEEVLEYIKDYYLGDNPTGDSISVTFIVTDVTLQVIGLGSVNYEDGINDDEFWAIEATCNDLGDDKYGEGDPVFGSSGVYSSQWKWILFGTSYEADSRVAGYCYIVRQSTRRQWDLLAGNYMFIADETADNWAGNIGIEPYGAKVVVLMHEIGHSIGIGILDWMGREVYCSNSECVMSYLSVNNADNYLAWFYCDDHWATRNMEYYAITWNTIQSEVPTYRVKLH